VSARKPRGITAIVLDKSPVFVVGAVRSGSTMFRLMLDAHPQISNPGEFDFLIEQVAGDGQLPEMRGYRRWLSTNRGFQDTGLEVDPRLNYVELIRSFINALWRDDKVLTLNMHLHFDRLPLLFPGARYIHLIRDPRDVARSSIGMGWAGNLYCGVDIWSTAERCWDRLAAGLTSDRYLEVRYETLLGSLTEELTRVCRFLGVDYSPEMLTYPARSTYGAPDAQLTYQWKGRCRPRELQWVDWKLQSLLVQRRYEPSGFGPKRPTLLDRLTIAIQDKYHRIRFRIRRYGFALYLGNLLASRAHISAWRESCQRRMNQIDVMFLK
jgi:Sulfotransferase family